MERGEQRETVWVVVSVEIDVVPADVVPGAVQDQFGRVRVGVQWSLAYRWL